MNREWHRRRVRRPAALLHGRSRARRAGGGVLLWFAFLGAVAGCGKDPSNPSDPGPGTPTRIRWSYDAPAAIYFASPALSPDERTIYFGTSLWLTGPPTGAHAIFALDAADGSLNWSLPLGTAQVRSSPVVADDGSIYCVLEGGGPTPDSLAAAVLCKLSPSGRIAWSYDIDSTRVSMEVGQSVPAIGTDGTVYVAGDRLYAIRSDGTLRWTAFEPTYEARWNSPVIGSDGTVYFVFHNIPLTALDPETGRALWSCPLGVNDHCLASPAIGADGTLYVATQPGIVYAVSSAGNLLWAFDIATVGFHGFLRSSPAVAADGTIYFGLNSGNPSSALFALRPDGSLRWIFEPSDLPTDTPPDHFDIYSSPAIGSDGTIYFGQEFGRVYALDPEEGTVRWIQTTRSGITWSSAALSADSTLFIADLSGRCYAIRTASGGLQAGSPWPRFRGNNQSTGRR